MGYTTLEGIALHREKLAKQWEKAGIIPGDTIIAAYENFYITVVGCMAGYRLAYSHLDNMYETQKLESIFNILLPSPVPYLEIQFRGKIDKIVRDKDNNYFVWERKTASQTGDQWWNASLLDSQGKGYCLAALESLDLNYPVCGVMYDVLKKPGIKKGNYENDEAFVNRLSEAYIKDYQKYFERRLIRFSNAEIEDYKQELIQLALEINALNSADSFTAWRKHHPRNRFGKCSFFPICIQGENELNMSNFYIRSEEDLFRELNEEGDV